MVPRAGLEPAQRERRGILNPLCLPIPPPGHAILYCDAPNHVLYKKRLDTIFITVCHCNMTASTKFFFSRAVSPENETYFN